MKMILIKTEKNLLISLLLLIGLTASFATEVKANQSSHQQHSGHSSAHRMGSHGMVLITDGENLYASHLPLYVSPHDYQLLYLVETEQSATLIDYLSTQPAQNTETPKMLTLLPEIFDLNRLISGETFTIDASIYRGHFERGGKEWITQPVHFKRLVYRRHLTDAISESSYVSQWHVIALSDKQQLLVHQITKAPSFDAIYFARDCSEVSNSPLNIEVFIEAQELSVQFRHCQQQQPLYVEFQDFAE